MTDSTPTGTETDAETPELDAGWSETIRIDGVDVAAADLPWWRRPRRLRRQLIGTLVIVAFASVALVGGLNFVAAQRLLDDGTRDQLASIGEARARSIETGIERTESQASAAAADLAVVRALEDFSNAFTTRSTGRIDEAQLAELDEFYERTVVEPVEAADLGPVAVDDVRPLSDAGQYLQYHYTLPEADDAGPERGGRPRRRLGLHRSPRRRTIPSLRRSRRHSASAISSWSPQTARSCTRRTNGSISAPAWSTARTATARWPGRSGTSSRCSASVRA